jgi:hypothetical protein
MSQNVMIALVGEQPIPNLLPVRHDKPNRVILVHTQRTRLVSQRLTSLLGDAVVTLEVTPYDIMAIQQALKQFISERGWMATEVNFNLTGGTKPMAFAAYRLAEELSSSFMYLQSEGGKSLIYRYEFSEWRARLVREEEIPSVLTIDDYLRAHLGDYEEGPLKQRFEKMVYDTLCPVLDEIKTSVKHGGALEVDLVLRCGNQVGVSEVKSGRKAQSRKGIDQLNTAAEQRYLGTYTRKFLIVDRLLGSNNRALAEGHRIMVIELCSAATGSLSDEDRGRLITTIRKELGGQQ